MNKKICLWLLCLLPIILLNSCASNSLNNSNDSYDQEVENDDGYMPQNNNYYSNSTDSWYRRWTNNPSGSVNNAYTSGSWNPSDAGGVTTCVDANC